MFVVTAAQPIILNIADPFGNQAVVRVAQLYPEANSLHDTPEGAATEMAAKQQAYPGVIFSVVEFVVNAPGQL